MTSASPAAAPPSTSGYASSRVVTSTACAVAALAVGLVIAQRPIRVFEAHVSALVLDGLSFGSSDAIGSAVVFAESGRLVGFTLTLGCTAALLLIPFFLVAAGLIASRRIHAVRAARSLVVATLVVLIVNQLRFLVVAVSMRVWGHEKGYERSHVFLGSVLSTAGLMIGVMVFVLGMAKDGDTKKTSGPSDG